MPPVEPFPALLASEMALLDQVGEAVGDPWMEAAVLNSLRTLNDLRAAWQKLPPNSSGGFDSGLLTMIGRSGDDALIGEVSASLASQPIQSSLASRISALLLGAGYGRRPTAAITSDARWKPLLDKASAVLKGF